MATDFKSPIRQHMAMGDQNYLLAWREYRGLSQKTVGERAGTDKSQISKLEKGERRLTEAWLKRLAKAHHVEPRDLLGPPPEDGNDGAEINVQQSSTESGMRLIREIDLRAVSGTDASQIEVWPERIMSVTTQSHGFPIASFRQMTGTSPDGVVIVEVVGDSMTPTLRPGQKVIIDTKDRWPTPPGIFIVWDGMGLVLKRAAGVPFADPPRVRISSDNERYEPYERLIGEAYIQGRVVGFWERT